MKKTLKFSKKSRLVVVQASLMTFGLAWMELGQAEVKPAKSGYEHYVTDSLDVPFRTNPGYKYRILRMIKTGSKVKVLEVNDKKWARVNYIDKKGRSWDGWMPSVLLQNEPVAKVKFQQQLKKFSNLETKFNQQQLDKQTLQKRFDNTMSELKSIQKAHFQLNKEYEQLRDISKNSIALNSENNTLKSSIQKLNSENMIIKEQLNEAKDVVQRQWFLTGGGVLLLGLLLGRFARLPEKRKKWNSL